MSLMDQNVSDLEESVARRSSVKQCSQASLHNCRYPHSGGLAAAQKQPWVQLSGDDINDQRILREADTKGPLRCISAVLSSASLVTKQIHGRPPISTRIRARYHTLSQTGHHPHIGGRTPAYHWGSTDRYTTPT